MFLLASAHVLGIDKCMCVAGQLLSVNSTEADVTGTHKASFLCRNFELTEMKGDNCERNAVKSKSHSETLTADLELWWKTAFNAVHTTQVLL